jgi:ribosome biogenesis GTPase / thiamine phosphate phosphatase
MRTATGFPRMREAHALHGAFAMQLQLAGWNESWAQQFSQYFNDKAGKGLLPARVLAQHRQKYSLWTESGEADAEVAGAFLYRAEAGDLPAVGDWVAVRQYSPADVAIIAGVLPRKTSFSRKVSGPAA